jgi:hypothetical protein
MRQQDGKVIGQLVDASGVSGKPVSPGRTRYRLDVATGTPYGHRLLYLQSGRPNRGLFLHQLLLRRSSGELLGGQGQGASWVPSLTAVDTRVRPLRVTPAAPSGGYWRGARSRVLAVVGGPPTHREPADSRPEKPLLRRRFARPMGVTYLR